MISKICATVDKNHIYNCTSKAIGRQGENICTQLEITLEDCLCDSWVYLHFEKIDGTTKVTKKLEIIDNVVTYEIGNDLLDVAGTLKVFVELHKDSGLVWKSSTKEYTVLKSFNGVDQIENKEDFITNAQKIVDEASELNEDYKTNIEPEIVLAIEKSDTALSIAKGANQCKTFVDYPTFIEVFNLIPKDKYEVGQDIRIIQVNVPDIWIAYIEEENIEYIYTTDEDFISELVTNGIVQIGYYKFGMLETQKVDLTEYIKNTDYATSSKAGIVRMWTSTEDGEIGLNISTEV